MITHLGGVLIRLCQHLAIGCNDGDARPQHLCILGGALGKARRIASRQRIGQDVTHHSRLQHQIGLGLIDRRPPQCLPKDERQPPRYHDDERYMRNGNAPADGTVSMHRLSPQSGSQHPAR